MRKITTLCTLALVLASCGGQSYPTDVDGARPLPTSPPTLPPSPPPPQLPPPNTVSAEGVYAGHIETQGNKLIFDTLILDDDTFWGIHSAPPTAIGALVPIGLTVGQGHSKDGVFAAVGLNKLNASPTEFFNFTGDYIPRLKLSGVITSQSGDRANLVSDGTLAGYEYNATARLADIAGDWRVTVLGGADQIITVGIDGGISGGSNACRTSGALSPRGTKNVFDSTITFDGDTCAMSGQTVHGIAFSYLFREGAVRQLFIAGLNGGHNSGAFMHGISATPSGRVTDFNATDVAVGTGETATANKIVTIRFTGWLYDANANSGHGFQFASSDDTGTPVSVLLGSGQVIAGWEKGIVGMKVGGKRTLVIPASMGYGTAGLGGAVPSNAGLVFDIELLGVN